jgi:signal peptide peptidase SppA
VNRLEFLSRALQSEAWAITPDALARLRQVAEGAAPLPPPHATDGEPSASTSYLPQVGRPGKRVALLTLQGVVLSRAPRWAESYGYLSPQAFAGDLRGLADDPTVGAIVLLIDSPGGTVSGTVDAADAVTYARSKKRVVAVCADMAASAAYWIAAQASEIITTPTALVGSIGVITSHTDLSGYYGQLGVVMTYIRSAAKKALGQPAEALSEQARGERQAMVDAIHVQFVQAVAKGRRTGRDRVAADWATGQIWVGQQAVTAGLVDRVASLNTLLGELTGTGTPPAASDPAPSPADDEEPDAQTPTAVIGAPDPPVAVQDAHPTDDPSTAFTPARDAQEDAPMTIAAISAKLAAGQPLSAEERQQLDTHLNAQSGSTPPAASGAAPVDLGSLSPEARALVEQAQAEAVSARQEAASATATANGERDRRLDREFTEQARALGLPDAMGATLRSASEKLSAEEYSALEGQLRATGAQNGLLSERGSSTDHRSSGNVQSEYESRVTAAMKADGSLSRAAAGQKVMQGDPQFAARYRAG